MIHNTRIKVQRTVADEDAINLFLKQGGTVYHAQIGESNAFSGVDKYREFRKYRERGLKKLLGKEGTNNDADHEANSDD